MGGVLCASSARRCPGSFPEYLVAHTKMSGIGTHVDDSTCDFGAQRLADKTERSVHETDRETGGALWGVGGGETLIVGDIESAGVNADENLSGAGTGRGISRISREVLRVLSRVSMRARTSSPPITSAFFYERGAYSLFICTHLEDANRNKF